MVDLLVGTELSGAIARRLRDRVVHVPAHFDAEVLSAVGRLSRAGSVPEDLVASLLEAVESSGFERHPVHPLLQGAWRRRSNLRLVDALYVELAASLDVSVVSTDGALAAAMPIVEVIRDGD